MRKIAIDVVIIPPKEIYNQCVEFSKQVAGNSKNNTIILDYETCIPHITLAMALVNEKDLPFIEEKIKYIISKIKPFELSMKNIHIEEIPTKDKVSGIDIVNTTFLQRLHEDITSALEPFLQDNATIDAFYPIPKPAETSLFWVKGFKEHSSFRKYNPHITIGFGELKNAKIPDFIANTIAIAQLGNYCTCRKIFHKFNLS